MTFFFRSYDDVDSNDNVNDDDAEDEDESDGDDDVDDDDDDDVGVDDVGDDEDCAEVLMGGKPRFRLSSLTLVIIRKFLRISSVVSLASV